MDYFQRQLGRSLENKMVNYKAMNLVISVISIHNMVDNIANVCNLTLLRVY